MICWGNGDAVIADQSGKFIASDTEDTAPAENTAQLVSCFQQDMVTCVMAEGIVDFFEMVDVDQFKLTVIFF